MDWGVVGDVIGGVSTAASGGIFGLIGSGIGVVAKYFQQKQAHKQKLEIMDMEMRVNSQEGSWDGLESSQLAEAAAVDTYKWVNAIRILYRPFLTTVLVVVSYLLFRDILSGLANAGSVLTEIFTGPELKEILRYNVYSIIFTTSTAIVWWFGDRAFTPPGLKNR